MNTMGKSIVDEVKQEIKSKKKEENKMKNQTLKETLKTIAITILVTAIVAFIAGVKYQESNTSKIQSEAKSLAASAQVAPSKQ